MDGDFWIGKVPGVGDFTMLSYASVYTESTDPSPEVRQVLADYLAATGHRASDGRVVTGHDAIEAYARAVERAGTPEPGAVVSDAAVEPGFWRPKGSEKVYQCLDAERCSNSSCAPGTRSGIRCLSEICGRV